MATICGMDYDTNLWAGVNLVDDMDVIQIDKLTNAGERYFFKMLMKADTNIAWGEDVIMLDARETKVATLAGTTVTMATPVSTLEDTPTEDAVFSVTGDGVILGARLTITNKASDKKISVGDIEIAGGKTAVLGYDGKKWFKAAEA